MVRIVMYSNIAMQYTVITIIGQKKLRRQTSDSMERWKAEKRRVEERRVEEKNKREQSKREKEKESQERRYTWAKCQESRQTLCFQWFVGREGRKVGSLKRRALSRGQMRWDMKNGTPLRREADFQVKMKKNSGSRTSFGSSDADKWHAALAKAHFKVKMHNTHVRAIFRRSKRLDRQTDRKKERKKQAKKERKKERKIER